jgi:hypothetical protein
MLTRCDAPTLWATRSVTMWDAFGEDESLQMAVKLYRCQECGRWCEDKQETLSIATEIQRLRLRIQSECMMGKIQRLERDLRRYEMISGVVLPSVFILAVGAFFIFRYG